MSAKTPLQSPAVRDQSPMLLYELININNSRKFLLLWRWLRHILLVVLKSGCENYDEQTNLKEKNYITVRLRWWNGVTGRIECPVHVLCVFVAPSRPSKCWLISKFDGKLVFKPWGCPEGCTFARLNWFTLGWEFSFVFLFLFFSFLFCFWGWRFPQVVAH